jgi:hypothetical protein
MAVAVAIPDPSSSKVSSSNPPSYDQQQQQQQQYMQPPQPPQPPVLQSMLPPTPFVSQDQLQHLYNQHKFTPGLCNAVTQTLNDFSYRIWVVDNSGSMAAGDGKRQVTTSTGATKMVSCTRWDEIAECVTYHASLARDVTGPTKFRMMNPTALSGHCMSMGMDGNDFHGSFNTVMSCMQRSGPGGVTPLAGHVNYIRREIDVVRHELETTGKKVCVVLATDGLPSDNQGYSNNRAKSEFVSSLRSLVGYPVWVVIRLCTDEDDVCEFYNELDGQVELNFEVIDDFAGEAKEVYEQNPWLNYGLPLHRLREWGYANKLLDLLDERPLMIGEVKQLVAFLLGIEQWDIPDPQVDFTEFVTFVNDQQENLRPVFNVVKSRLGPWIDCKKLAKQYGKKGCVIS